MNSFELQFDLTTQENLLPETNGKFVQLQHPTLGEFLVLATENRYRFHANIIDSFCQRQTPPWRFQMNLKRDYGEPIDHHFEIIGGGYWYRNKIKKVLDFYGSSQAFGPYSAEQLVDKIKQTDFNHYKINA